MVWDRKAMESWTFPKTPKPARFYWRHRWEGLFLGLCSLLSWWFGVSGSSDVGDHAVMHSERVGQKIKFLHFFPYNNYRIHVWPIDPVGLLIFVMGKVGKYSIRGSILYGYEFVHLFRLPERCLDIDWTVASYDVAVFCFHVRWHVTSSWELRAHNFNCTVRWLQVLLYHGWG